MKKTNKSIAILSIVTILVLLSGCNDHDTITNGTSNSTDTFPEVTQEGSVPYTVLGIRSYDGKIYKIFLGADGDFIALNGNNGPIFAFADSVSFPYTVDSLIINETLEVSDSTTTSYTTITSDFAEGTQHLHGTRTGYGLFDCERTYQTPLPVILSYVAEDLPRSFDPETRISTTCPTWVIDNPDDINNSSSAYALQSINITVNGTSHISKLVNISY